MFIGVGRTAAPFPSRRRWNDPPPLGVRIDIRYVEAQRRLHAEDSAIKKQPGLLYLFYTVDRSGSCNQKSSI